ncbi:MAG: xanthine dehydrogenase family protein molybdopterin-binding subunit [Anaerolineales bacterium]|nr:xanthine dehydrogenase family protein molybdopterin-binding subunit [Anaerolineales bacterium]
MSAPRPNKPAKKRLTRRGALILGGLGLAGAAGLYVGFDVLRRNALDNLSAGGPPNLGPNAWLQITPEGRARLLMPKAEMGQGVHTATAQIVAEELGLPLARVDVDLADTGVLPVDSFGTAGSTTVATLYPELRRAAAIARRMVLAEAAARLNVDSAELDLIDGRIVRAGGPTALNFEDLIGGRQIIELAEGETPAYRPVADYTIIGAPAARLDLPDKVIGAARYGYDARVEGMRFGKVLRPPRLGATLRSADAGAASTLPGVVTVVNADGFVGVVATTQEIANQALSLIQAEWNEPATPATQAQIEPEALRPGGFGGDLIGPTAGDAEGALRGAVTVIEAEYFTPAADHAALEPQNGTAHVRQVDGAWRADVWASTQNPNGLKSSVARALGLDANAVVIHPQYLGGGFGLKAVNEAAAEAARLSRAAGVPVRVNWDRAEEFQHGYKRPPTVNVLKAGLNADGALTGWTHDQASGLVISAFFPAFVRPIIGRDFGATRALNPMNYYAVSDHRTRAWMRDTPMRTGSWRGLGLLPNIFAIESFMDELAHAAGVDPLDFRLRHLGPSRLAERVRGVLSTVAELSGWASTPLSPSTDGWVRGRGLACCDDGGTVVAQVAEVAVDTANGEVRVERIYCAIEAGLIINPDIVTAQVESAVMWGVGSTLIEETRIENGAIRAVNFNAYPLLRISQAPEVVTRILSNANEGPFGMGEPPIGPVAAAIANAVFAATGARLRRLPFTPERVLARNLHNKG